MLRAGFAFMSSASGKVQLKGGHIFCKDAPEMNIKSSTVKIYYSYNYPSFYAAKVISKTNKKITF